MNLFLYYIGRNLETLSENQITSSLILDEIWVSRFTVNEVIESLGLNLDVFGPDEISWHETWPKDLGHNMNTATCSPKHE